MSTYCKAYTLAKFRKFNGWTEESENARKEIQIENGKEIESPRKLTDNDFLYLHDSYVVTDGIFENRNIIFSNITSEWREFCQQELKFNVPQYGTNNENNN